MTLTEEVKRIVADTYLAYDTSYSGSQAYDSYLEDGELGIATEALSKVKLGQQAIREEMVDLFSEILCPLEKYRN